ncbi:MAG: hypothetical protein NW237_07385 [Cyanobacteriota bacterium]|nr:hypothetical protein [Cyanobacteriota bacterium]
MKVSLLTGLIIIGLTLGWSLEGETRTRTRTTTGQQGRSVTAQSTASASGGGQYSRQGTYQTTGRQGQIPIGSFAGSGTLTHTPGQGIQNDYTGMITNQSGQTWGVERSATYSQTEGSRQRSGTTTVTDPQGAVVGSSQSTTSYTPETGFLRNGTTTRRGTTTTSESTATQQGDGTWQKNTQVSNSQGETVAGATTSIDITCSGSQTCSKTVSGETLRGYPIDRQTTIQLNP